jgi:DNA polymerase-3 subunit delta'
MARVSDGHSEGRLRGRFEGRILDALVGHETVVAPLMRSIAGDRLTAATIFAGPSGVGKKMAALGLAQALVCERERRACGACGPCARMARGQSESLLLVEPQGVSIKVEQARDVLGFLSLRGLGRARVVVIDQAHAMNSQAANALLKVLEEPPPDAFFFLLTNQASALLPTIRSRAQMARFAPLSDSELARALALLGEAPLSAASLRQARGSVADALRQHEEGEAQSEAHAAVVQLLSAPVAPFPFGAIGRLREACADRASALFAARAAQEIARDLAHRAIRGGSAPESAGVTVAHPQIALREAVALGGLALAAESDILGNVDRGLIFENLWFSWSRALRLACGDVQAGSRRP